MATFTARNGTVNFGGVVSDVTNIQYDDQGNASEYASSSTSGWFKKTAGNKKLTGSFDFKHQSGTAVPFKANATGTLTITKTSGDTISGPIMVINVPTQINIESGEAVAGTVNFESDGQWSDLDP